MIINLNPLSYPEYFDEVLNLLRWIINAFYLMLKYNLN